MRHTYGRVVELVDSLDSGSSVHCGRAGSSPASPTKNKSTSKRMCFCFFDLDGKKIEPIQYQRSAENILAAFP